MDSDPRIKEVLDVWSRLYQKKYSIPYPFNWKKEAKLVQKLITYLDGFCVQEAVVFKLKDGFERYLGDSNAFYANDKHPLSKFCSIPQRWMVYEARKQPVVEVKEVVVKDKKTPDEIYEAFTTWAVEYPEQAMKGFAFTHKALKRHNEELYQRIRAFLLDLIGKDRAVSLFNEVTSDGIVHGL